ncbi:MAG: hypothetical protein R2932_05815 [Caldilineaceae bacterium]
MNSNSAAGAGNLARQFYQIWKALRDPSIPWAAKWLIPLAALAYWVSPIDLIPFFPLDDIVVVLIAMNLFVQMLSRYQTPDQSGAGANNTNRTQWQSREERTAYDTNRTIETTWRVVEE